MVQVGEQKGMGAVVEVVTFIGWQFEQVRIQTTYVVLEAVTFVG